MPHVSRMLAVLLRSCSGSSALSLQGYPRCPAASLHIEYPMLFNVANRQTGRSTHCGVLEFIADEGHCYLPYWVRGFCPRGFCPLQVHVIRHPLQHPAYASSARTQSLQDLPWRQWSSSGCTSPDSISALACTEHFCGYEQCRLLKNASLH